MNRNLESLKKEKFDLLIIGGGINGAGIANLASRQGLRTVLLEKGDFASGTSGKSSKLAHGGIRYLEQFQFHLVRESLRERYFHVREVPHLVRPIPFMIPVYDGDRRPLWMMRAGVFLYDLLAGKMKLGRHKNLSAAQVLEMEPSLKRGGLKGGVLYYDAQMDDARLCLENALQARLQGAVVENYVRVNSFIKENGKAAGVKACDVLNGAGSEFEIRAKRIVAAAGPWANEIIKMDQREAPDRVRTTKGIHLVVPHPVSANALLIPSSRDNRIFFVIPWNGNSLIGTTDTDYFSSPDNVKADEEDIRYLIEETKRVFPGFTVNREDMITFAGLRPLVRHEGSPSNVSREHEIFNTASGVIFITGGKYTTYRVMAEQCLARIIPVKKDGRHSIYGGGAVIGSAEAAARDFGLDPDIVRSLMEKYGSRYRDVLEIAARNPSLKERICPHAPLVRAQIVYAREKEMAETGDDVIFRRLGAGYNACLMKECRQTLTQAVQELMR